MRAILMRNGDTYTVMFDVPWVNLPYEKATALCARLNSALNPPTLDGDTPETDAATVAFAHANGKKSRDMVSVDFARRLELERNAARKRVAELEANAGEGEMWMELMELIPESHLVSSPRGIAILGGRRVSNAMGIVHFPDKYPAIDVGGTLSECLAYAREKWGKEANNG